jgi:hypothetical protein
MTIAMPIVVKIGITIAMTIALIITHGNSHVITKLMVKTIA